MNGLTIGVRADDDEVAGALERALEPWRTETDASRANLSLRRGDGRSFHVLFWGGCAVIRTRDARRVVEGLFGHLAGHDRPAAGTARVWGTAIVASDGSAAVVVGQTPDLLRLDRRLRQRGARLVDRPWVHLDLGTATVRVPEPLPVATDDAERLVTALGAGPAEAPVPPGNYVVRSFVTIDARLGARFGDRTFQLLAATQTSAPDDVGALAAIATDRPWSSIAIGRGRDEATSIRVLAGEAP